MKISVILIVFGLLVLQQQCSDKQTSWKNPEIDCRLNEKEKPVKKFPENTGLATAIGMADFGKRMQEKFSNSGLTAAQAKVFYKILYENTFLKKSAYGMPANDENYEKIKSEEYSKKIAVRKISGTEYEIYYSYAACGMNYDYLKIFILNGKVTKTDLIEAWKGSFPC